MKNKITLLLLAMMIIAPSFAQGTCRIEGKIEKESLRSGEKMKKIVLSSLDSREVITPVDSVVIKGGKFSFEVKLTKEYPSQVYLLTGFDNGTFPFWVEEGVVKIVVPDAAFPSRSTATGTPTNEIASAYRKISEDAIAQQVAFLNQLKAEKGEEWLDSKESYETRALFGARAVVKQYADKVSFILGHMDSPFVPFIMEKELRQVLDEGIMSRLMRGISPDLRTHPYYISCRDLFVATTLKAGKEVPNIELPMLDGKTTKHLSDYEGKIVLLDFWASWCGPCRKEIPHLKSLYEQTKEDRDKFVILSFSLDEKKEAWQGAINQYAMGLPDWDHASDLKGWKSEAARLLGVTGVPKTFLIGPNGRLIAIDLRGPEMIVEVRSAIAQMKSANR